MKALRRFFERLTAWTSRGRDEARLEAEIEEHITLQTGDNIRAGMSPREARRQAVLDFGAIEGVKEDIRATRGLPLLETLIQDVRHTVRRLAFAPAFTITVIVILALGLGAATSIFTLAHAVLLQPLPVPDPDELYRVGATPRCCYQGGYVMDPEFSLVSYELYQHLRDNTGGFTELAAFSAVTPALGVRRSGSSEPAQSRVGELVSGNYFAMFGVPAHAGRVLTPKDDTPEAPPVAMMSHRLWQDAYGSDPGIVGGSFQLNGQPFTVVGITPPGFYGDTLRASPPDFFVPLNAEPLLQADADLRKHAVHWLEMIGRLEPDAEPASIQAWMRLGLQQWLRSHSGEMSSTERAALPNQTLNLVSGRSGITSLRAQSRTLLQILMAAAGLVLLIVCANVADLMMVRGMERRQQTSLSMALGASSSRMVRQALTETFLLSLVGGVAGIGVALVTTRLIVRFAFPESAGAAGLPIGAWPSAPGLLFAFGITLLASVLCGTGPAWFATRANPIEALRGASRSTGNRSLLPRKTLVAIQAAICVVLLTAAGMVTGGLRGLERQPFGFETEGRLVVNMNPRLAGYQGTELPRLYRRIRESLSGVRGVSSVALSLYSPLSGGGWGALVFAEGDPVPAPGNQKSSYWNRVTPEYLDVVGTPILRGRGFTERDSSNAPHVAVVNEAFARTVFPGEDPIGKRFGPEFGASQALQVVGVAADARYLTFNLSNPVEPFYFVPEAQADYSRSNMGSLFLRDIVVAAAPGNAPSGDEVLEALATADPALPIGSVRTLDEQVAVQFGQQRLIARLSTLFGLVSLVLASVGLYGVTAYNVSRRTGEIGVRMALGAGRGRIVQLVLRGVFGIVSVGVIAGVPAAFGIARLLRSQFFGLNPFDPAVTLAAVAVLAVAALLASLLPAWRASSISAVDALKSE